jgi:GTP cyclohydrolase I
MIVKIPVTAVCPCSKEISDYGAHNQRGIVTIEINIHPDYKDIIWIEDLIKIAEKNSSCELFPILKRADEKYVTEKGYRQAQFVEDTVRKIANEILKYKEDNKILNYKIECMNYESIHNHEAYAMIRG